MDLSREERQHLKKEAEVVRKRYAELKQGGDSPEINKERERLRSQYADIDRLLSKAQANVRPAVNDREKQSKICPCCAQKNLLDAKKCRFCDERLEWPTEESQTPEFQQHYPRPAIVAERSQIIQTQAMVPEIIDPTTRRGLIFKVCDRGSLRRKRIYRFSAPIIVIGYILLIPAALGIIFGILMVAFIGIAGVATGEPGLGIAAFLSGGTFILLLIIVPSLVSGLLGFLLILQKRILKCTSCGAVVDAS